MQFCDINNGNKKNKKRVGYTHHTTLFRIYTHEKKEANQLQLTNRFSHFCRPRGYVQQKDRHTLHATSTATDHMLWHLNRVSRFYTTHHILCTIKNGLRIVR